MRTIVDLRKYRCAAGVIILLVAAVLAMWLLGCNDGGGGSCTLTITSSAGGVVTKPGEGAFTYDVGAVIDLVATADEGHAFHGWTGDTGGVANPGSTTTSIMLIEDCSITANFGSTNPRGPSTP